MKERKKIVAGVIVIGLVLAGVCLFFIEAQDPPEVTLRYSFNIGDTWKYECVTEKEKNHELAEGKNTYLRNIKEHFGYEVISTGNYTTVKLTTTPIEGKGVNIVGGKKEEKHYSGAKHEYEELLTTKGEIWEILVCGTEEKFPIIGRIKENVITSSLVTDYNDMINLFRPVMPEEPVEINDTWTYSVLLLTPKIALMPDLVTKDPIALATFTYKIVGFEIKEGLDCVKVEYTYDWDFSDKLNSWAEENEAEDWLEFELKVKGSGTFYFAYNEGFLVSRKENLMLTNRIELTGDEPIGIDNKWLFDKSETTIERIGFTMNYLNE